MPLLTTLANGSARGFGLGSSDSVYVADLAGTYTETKLSASDAQSIDEFGKNLSINGTGEYLISGARNEDTVASNAGAAYIFKRTESTWSQQAKLTASDGQASDGFGYDVEISKDGNYAIVGAWFEDGGSGDPTSNAGAGYVFVRSGSSWTQQAKLVASDAGVGYLLGLHVSINEDGTYVALGASGEDTNGTDSGAVYIFVRSGSSWSQQQKIEQNPSYSTQRFSKVSLNSDGTYLLAGATNVQGPPNFNGQGAVYVFTRSGSTWTQQQGPIFTSDGQSSDTFGHSIAINEDATTFIASALNEDGGSGDPISSAGAAYIFTRSGSTWTEQAKIVASDAQASDTFGRSVAISKDGNIVVVGTTAEDGGAGDPLSSVGAFYVFERTGSSWTQKKKILSSDGDAFDSFANEVSISDDGNYIIAGAHSEDGGSGNAVSAAGAVYVYEVPSA